MWLNYTGEALRFPWQITVIYLIKDYKAMAEVNSSGCFFFSESKVSNHIDSCTHREQGREKAQCS